MEEEIDPSQDYVDSFNLGYELNKLSPEIAELLSGFRENNPQLKAIKAGIIEHGKEQNPSRLPDWLLKDRFADSTIEITRKQKDIDKEIEPDL